MKFLLSIMIIIGFSQKATSTIFPPFPSDEVFEKNGCMLSCDATYDDDFDICNYLPDEDGWKECHERAKAEWQRCYELCEE